MSSASRSHPRDPQKYHYWVALRAHRGGDHVAAARMFEALATRQDLCGLLSRFYAGDAHLRAGVNCLSTGVYEEATTHFRSAMHLNPEHAPLSQYLATELPSRLRLVDSRALGAPHRQRPDSRVGLALSLWKTGHHIAAVTTLEQGVRKAPGNADWHYHLGVLHAARDDHELAIAALERALEIRADHAGARMHLGLCHGALGRPDQAVEQLRIAQHLQPHNAQVGLLLVMASKAAGVASPARSLTLNDAVEVEDLEALERLLRIEPQIANAFVDARGRAEDPGLFVVLEAALERVLDDAVPSAELLYHLGRVRTRRGDVAGAIQACRRALEIDPQFADAHIALAKLYCDTKRPADAVSRLELVLELGFEYADVHYLLGCLYRDRGEPDRARTAYARALEINARYGAAREALENLAA